MSAAILLKGFSAGYGKSDVLKNLDLQIDPGELVCLLGPNGSGKSTFLKSLTRTLPSYRGLAQIDGREIGEYSDLELARKIAFVPQEEHIAFAFNVREIVLMGRIPYSDGLFDSAEDHAIAENAMVEADVIKLSDRSAHDLSGGERQRVLIARALAQQAPILLLDEPTAHLDFEHQLELVDILRNQARKGVTIVAALHDVNLAASFAQTAVLMHAGKIHAHVQTSDLINSDHLDEVYSVTFGRIHREAGNPLLVPISRRR